MYTFYSVQLTTGQIGAELPLVRVSAQRHLKLGAFSADLDVGGLTQQQRREVIAAIQPWRHTIVITRGEVCVGEWVIRRVRPDVAGTTWSIEGTEVAQYLDRRRVSGWSWTNQDQLTRAWSLITEALAGDGSGRGAVACIIPPPSASGVVRAPQQIQARQSSSLRAVQDLAELADGFEWTITPRIVGQTIERTLALWYPQAGRDTDFVFDAAGTRGSGGNIRDLGLEYNGDLLRGQVWAIGAGEGESRKIGSRSDLALINAGYPYLEDAYVLSLMNQQGLVDAYAAAMLAVGQIQEVPPKVKVAADGVPSVGDYGLGDRVTVTIDPTTTLPDGYSARVRIIGWTLTPPAAGAEDIVELEVTSLVEPPRES